MAKGKRPTRSLSASRNASIATAAPAASPAGEGGGRLVLQLLLGVGILVSLGIGLYVLLAYGKMLIGVAAILVAVVLVLFFPTGQGAGDGGVPWAEAPAVPAGDTEKEIRAASPSAEEQPRLGRGGLVRLLLLAAAAGMGTMAQLAFRGNRYDPALAWLAGAAVCILFSLLRRPEGVWTAVRRSVLAILCLVGFGLGTQHYLDAYSYGATSLFLLPCLYAAGTCLVLAYFGSPPDLKIKFPRGAEIVGFCFVMAVAIGMRTYHLDKAPNGIYLDEGDQSVQSIKILEDKNYRPFFVGGGLRVSTFHNYWLSLWFKIAGVNAKGMRTAIAVVGIATVAAFYFLAREMFHAPLALILAFLFAVSHWHVNFSRFNANAVWVPLLECVIFYGILRGARTGRYLLFAIAGLAVGLGMYTYFSFFVLPPLAILFLGFLLINHTQVFARRLLPILAMVAVAVIVYTPFLNYQLKHPGEAGGRLPEVIVTKDIERSKSFEPLKDNIRKGFFMVNWKGDTRPRHNLPHEPMADPVTGVLFALGVLSAVVQFWKPAPFLVLTAYWATMQAGIWTLNDSAPHSLRQIANSPLIFLFAGFFLNQMWGLVRRTGGHLAFLVPVLTAVGYAGWHNADTIFRRHYGFTKENPMAQSVYYDYSPQENEIALFMKERGAGWKFFLEPAFDNFCQVWFYNYREKNYDALDLSGQIPMTHVEGKNVGLVAPPQGATLLPYVRHTYPGVEVVEKKDPWGGGLFTAYVIKREEIAQHAGLSAEAFPQPMMRGSASPAVRVEAPLALVRGTGQAAGTRSLRLTGTLYAPKSALYTFTVSSLRVAIDGDWKIDASAASAPVARSERWLGRGAHAVTIESVAAPNPGASLLWAYAGREPEEIPANRFTDVVPAEHGLYGRFWRGSTWQGVPIYGKVDPTLYFEWTEQVDPFMGSAPMGNEPLSDPFSAEWTAWLDVPVEGDYGFDVKSVHGSQLFVDGTSVVENLGSHDLELHSGRRHLTAGPHKIRYRFFHEMGGRKIEVCWTRPGSGVRELLPWELLRPDRAVSPLPPGPRMVLPAASNVAPARPGAPGDIR